MMFFGMVRLVNNIYLLSNNYFLFVGQKLDHKPFDKHDGAEQILIFGNCQTDHSSYELLLSPSIWFFDQEVLSNQTTEVSSNQRS